MTFNEAVEVAMDRNSHFDREAYIFLREVLEFAMKRRHKEKKGKSNGHIHATEILECFRLHGLKEFGPMAPTVFVYWGIRSSEDVGKLVFALVDANFLTKTEEDTVEAFKGGYSFVEAFSRPFQPFAENE